MSDIWEPVVGTRFFTRNGVGLYERLTPRMYLRVDNLDEADEIECCQQLAGRPVVHDPLGGSPASGGHNQAGGP
jgi:hypothetical protein